MHMTYFWRAEIPEGWPQLPGALSNRVAGKLPANFGNDPLFQPRGMQKFEWDPEARELKEAWANPELSSPNSVPYIRRGSDLIYTIGAREGQWTLEGVDLGSGDSAFHYLIGGARYNSLFAGIQLDHMGRIIYGNPFGKTRLDIE